MKFNFCSSLEFPPELKIDGFKENIQVTTETKLLFIIVTDNLKWVPTHNTSVQKNTKEFVY